MPTIDQPPPVLALADVEMDLRGVLPKPRGQHMLGLLDRDGIDMVDHLAKAIVAPAMRLAGEAKS
jgi:hypothetical protein